MPPDLPKLPPRPAAGHKGTFGTVAVVGGQAAAPRVMVGGPAFAAQGALRAGAGLVVLAVPAPLMGFALTVAPGATGLALPVDDHGELVPSEVAALLDEYGPQWSCVVAGPGLGSGEPQQRVVLRIAARADLPAVLDADALNALAARPDFQGDLRAPAILTPHPGEYGRLAAALGVEADPVDPGRRPEAAQRLAERLGCIVVLKGAGTIVSNGLETWRNPTGNVALATAGTGDVLAGVIAGLTAQFHFGQERRPGAGDGGATLSLYDCARLGVYLHGLAADRWRARRGEAGMLATDLLDEIPGALAEMRGESD